MKTKFSHITYQILGEELNLNQGWISSDEFKEYLVTTADNRFDYETVYNNQIEDATHPPLYYVLVHTICSIFPNEFNNWLLYTINAIAMTGAIILIYKIVKNISNNKVYAILSVLGYCISIACITATIYLRMYALLIFLSLEFLYTTLKLYDKDNSAKLIDYIKLSLIVAGGFLTHLFFAVYAGLIGLVFLVLTIKHKRKLDLASYIVFCLLGILISIVIYPYMISDVLGGNRGVTSLEVNISFITAVTYLIYKFFTYIQILIKELFVKQLWLFVIFALAVLGFIIYRIFKKRSIQTKWWYIILPGIIPFVIIALVSPFNSDRYVMASLPLLSIIFTMTFIKMFEYIKNSKLRIIIPASILLAMNIAALIVVKPYYVYGKTNLYTPKTSYCILIGTLVKEWNKNIDKLMQYDGTMIIQTNELSKTLPSQITEFGKKRGIKLNGEAEDVLKGYLNNNSFDQNTKNNLQILVDDEKLKSLSDITIYISKLTDQESIIKYITENTDFKNYKIIQKDYEIEEFYNWYDYFEETESYCTVYYFYK